MRSESVIGFKTGQITVSSSAKTGFPDGTPKPLVSIGIKALLANTGIIYIGQSDVSSSSFPLDPGESIDVELLEPAHIYFLAATNGDKIAYIIR